MKKTFQKKIFIPFHRCDVAGILFFGEMFSFAHQLYEHFVMEQLHVVWDDWFQNPNWILPIKHTEADYKIPLKAGQSYEMKMELIKVGETSIAFDFHFLKDEVVHCKLKTVHVFCDRQTGSKMAIPEAIREKLMPVIHPNVVPVSKSFKALLLDAYGVFWHGNEVGLLPGAKETMAKLVSKGKIIGILSNSTQLAANEIAKLDKHGINKGQHFHFIVTSGEISKSFFVNAKLPFKTPNNKFWILGETHPRFSSPSVLFEGSPYQETKSINKADFVFVSIPHIRGVDQTDPELFRLSLTKILEKKLPMVCSNPDRFAHEGMPAKAVVRQGSLAAMYQEMGGDVFYIGKPYKDVYAASMEHFQNFEIFNPSEVLMVGDTPETDIRGARQFGMASALVTQTGIMSERVQHVGLSEALKKLGEDQPNFLIERFGE